MGEAWTMRDQVMLLTGATAGIGRAAAHALAGIVREAPTMQGQSVVMNLSGRGDKDVDQMMKLLGPTS